MDQDQVPAAEESPSGEKRRRNRSQKGARPGKALPTDRIAFGKQLDLLRGYAAISGPGNKPATTAEVGNIVGLSGGTVALANAFFMDVGFLQRVDGGFLSAPEVIAFQRAYEWNPETASEKLGPLVRAAWFAGALMPTLAFRPMEEREAIGVFADAATAGPEYEPQLRLLLSFMEAAGIIQRDGQLIRQAKTAPATSVGPERPSSASEQRDSSRAGGVVTTFSQPTEGVVQFHVSVKVDMKEFAGWQPERISAFFNGIAQVLAAKGAVEKDASTS